MFRMAVYHMFTPADYVILVLTVLVTLWLIARKNPYPTNTKEYESLRLCRIGLGLAIWSFGFGLVGFAFALVAFILAILGVVKGRTVYGVTIIVLSVCLPLIGVLRDLTTLFSRYQ